MFSESPVEMVVLLGPAVHLLDDVLLDLVGLGVDTTLDQYHHSTFFMQLMPPLNCGKI